MNCPRCNAKTAFIKNRCDNCGQDLRHYRRIISLSNICYNHGLEQAKVRDLSGAVCSLRKSLEFNKKNTHARNLLGIIYYEEGEIVSALSEWVISKHFQPQNNDADHYIREIQSNSNRLEAYNQTIKKYNAALYSAKQGDIDMAVIQLKKVVNLNPKFIRANQLLALLYMMTGKKDNKVRAKRLLQQISKVDVTNTTTVSYLHELSDVAVKGQPSPAGGAVPAAEQRKTLPRVDGDAYKQITPYKEEKPSILPFVNIVIGAVIGMAVMGFLIMPQINASKSQKENSDFKKYSEEKAANASDVSSLKAERDKLEDELDKVKKENEKLKGGSGGETIQESYENLILAMQYYMDNNSSKAAASLAGVNEEILQSETAKETYSKIKEETYASASDGLFKEGRDAYNGEGDYAGHKDYDKAIELLEAALEYDENNTDALYFLGRCYQQMSDAEKAKEYYNNIVDNYPDSKRVSEAQRRLRELGE